jgi:hypothetical protein
MEKTERLVNFSIFIVFVFVFFGLWCLVSGRSLTVAVGVIVTGVD